jgi:hypothetical protein
MRSNGYPLDAQKQAWAMSTVLVEAAESEAQLGE